MTEKVRNGLLGKLNDAQKALDRGDKGPALAKLGDFITQVEGQYGKGISTTNGDLLLGYSDNLIALISG